MLCVILFYFLRGKKNRSAVRTILLGIAKGIRRVVCVTGQEARAAILRGDDLSTQFDDAKTLEGETLGHEISRLGKSFGCGL
jgi:hypothetical protein